MSIFIVRTSTIPYSAIAKILQRSKNKFSIVKLRIVNWSESIRPNEIKMSKSNLHTKRMTFVIFRRIDYSKFWFGLHLTKEITTTPNEKAVNRFIAQIKIMEIL